MAAATHEGRGGFLTLVSPFMVVERQFPSTTHSFAVTRFLTSITLTGDGKTTLRDAYTTTPKAITVRTYLDSLRDFMDSASLVICFSSITFQETDCQCRATESWIKTIKPDD